MIRIAMWSGPRNLSTAMMRSFGARPDTAVIDEPFYAAYLRETGADHPMREETLAGQENDAEKVATDLAHGARDAEIFYQKHMTHHMTPGIPRGWMEHVRHAFLIRHPARVLASYVRKRETVTLEDIGFRQQAEIFHDLRKAGGRPAVIDADDILAAPETALAALCEALRIPFDRAMLSWAPGPHPADGPWAPHWYGGVWRSSGFDKAPGPLPSLPQDLQPTLQDALAIYHDLYTHRLAIPCSQTD